MAHDPEALAALHIDRTAREPGRRGRRIAGVVTGVVLIAAAIGVWRWAQGARAAEVRTATAREVTGAATPSAVLNASGYVTARRRATVSSKVTGKVTEILVEEGMAVSRGQVLARLDDASAQAQLALADAQLAEAGQAVAETEVRLREATLTLDRTRELVRQGVAGQAALDAAEAEVDSFRARIGLSQQRVTVAEREVALRRTELADLTIVAPFSGVAISKDAQPGEMVSPISAGGGFTRTGICTIVDMSSLEIEVDVGESYINRVETGQRVEATLDAYPDWQIPATVITTVPAADRQRATVLVRIAFEELDPRILPDMGVKVAFLEPSADTAEQTPATRRTVIPGRAVRHEADRTVVYVLRQGQVERRAVQLGTAGAGLTGDVEVVAGVTAGELVVVEGPEDLTDGDRVTDR